MISLAGRDILHAWGKFVFTGIGLGLLIGVTLTMAGVYRGMVDDGKVLLDNSGADLWVVQKDTLGPYAESSSVPDDLWRGIRAMPGVAQAANITYLTMQVGHGDKDVRSMVVGITASGPGAPGWPPQLVAGRQITRGHYEAVADVAAGDVICAECPYHEEGGLQYWEISPMQAAMELDSQDEEMAHAVGQAVRYLVARGLLEPHPTNARLVRFLFAL